MHIVAKFQNKLDAMTEKCISIRYSEEKKGRRCYNPITKKMHTSGDVVFGEKSSCYTKELSIDTTKMALTVLDHRTLVQGV